MLAMNSTTPRGIRIPALSLTTIASKLAPTVDHSRSKACFFVFGIRQQHTCLSRISRLLTGLAGLSTDSSEFNRGLYVEQGDIFGLKSLEQANGLFFGNCHMDFGRLIGQLKKMRGMQFP
ncbi:hypothetical protein AN403_5542 [Pseudomonas fluorescens]|uniref:Uncharacterized protein n=1 Tax=Pseudomonas fluorescens TaxID=294 RepID=A0A0P8X4Z4_PSEFL|nr:hypothetical protein AN403_5542 [Pseudomonas fluorescens]